MVRCRWLWCRSPLGCVRSLGKEISCEIRGRARKRRGKSGKELPREREREGKSNEGLTTRVQGRDNEYGHLRIPVAYFGRICEKRAFF